MMSKILIKWNLVGNKKWNGGKYVKGVLKGHFCHIFIRETKLQS